MRVRIVLIPVLACLFICLGSAETTGEHLTVQLPPYGSELGTCIDDGGTDECI